MLLFVSIFQKFVFFSLSKIVQKAKEAQENHFCHILPVLDQNDILKEKKKCQNLLTIAEMFAIFETNSNVDTVAA